MIKNVGRLDQTIRVIAGVALIYIGFIDKEFISDPISSVVFGIIGILSLLVSLSRFCPLYILIGTDTLQKKDK